MTTAAIVLAVWAVLSFPAAVVVGCAIRAGALCDLRD